MQGMEKLPNPISFEAAILLHIVREHFIQLKNKVELSKTPFMYIYRIFRLVIAPIIQIDLDLYQ